MIILRKIKQATPLAAIALTLVLFGTGCSQKMAPVIPQKTLPTITTDWTSSAFANPENPFDSIGLMHNLGLDYVYMHLGGSYDTNLAETYVCQFFQNRWGYNADTLKIFLDTYLEQTGSPSATLDTLQALWLAYPHFQIYVREVDSIAMDTSMNPDSALVAMVSIEDSIVSDASVTSTQRTLGLPSLAFIRYSYAYSHNPSSMDKWPGHAQRRKSPQPLADDPGPGQADLTGMAGGAVGGFTAGTTIGAIGGFVGGGPVGALAGGATGGIGGFVMGGLSGGMTASLGAILGGTGGNFWDGFWGGGVGVIFMFF